jgi:hypothetical protein
MLRLDRVQFQLTELHLYYGEFAPSNSTGWQRDQLIWPAARTRLPASALFAARHDWHAEKRRRTSVIFPRTVPSLSWRGVELACLSIRCITLLQAEFPLFSLPIGCFMMASRHVRL